MGIRGVFLSVVAFTFAAAVPAWAQGGPGGLGPGGLAAQVAALQARVAALESSVGKLDGNANLETADLVGTYAVQAIFIPLRGLIPGVPPVNAVIGGDAFSGTIQVNGDGTLVFTSNTCSGSRLTQGVWSLVSRTCDAPGPNGNWAYSNGTVHVTAGQFDVQFSVALGGRLMTAAFAPFDAADLAADTFIIVLSRMSQP
jgi:hypothetical protein